MRGIASDQHPTVAPLIRVARVERVDRVSFEPRVVGTHVPRREQFPCACFVVQLVECLVRETHEFPAPPTRAARHRGGRTYWIADLQIDWLEHPLFVEHDVDDEPVEEEPEV